MSGRIPGGLLIAIEGIDGAGKTTVAHALGERLRAHGNQVTISKEPTAGPWGMKLRDSAQSGRLSLQDELELFRRDRLQHIEDRIAPALSRDEIFILDRYYYSTAAYQGAAGADVRGIIADSEAYAPRPNVAILLDLPVDIGLQRIRARGDKPNNFETVPTLEACRQIFLSLGRPEMRTIASSASIDDVLNACWGEVLAAIAEASNRAYGFTPAAAENVLAIAG